MTPKQIAEFWAENDATDFDGEEVVLEYKPKQVVISVRLDCTDNILLKRAADSIGVDKSTLVRILVKNYLGTAKPLPFDGIREVAATMDRAG